MEKVSLMIGCHSKLTQMDAGNTDTEPEKMENVWSRIFIITKENGTTSEFTKHASRNAACKCCAARRGPQGASCKAGWASRGTCRQYRDAVNSLQTDLDRHRPQIKPGRTTPDASESSCQWCELLPFLPCSDVCNLVKEKDQQNQPGFRMC